MLILFMSKTTWRKCLPTNILELIYATRSTGTLYWEKWLMEGRKLKLVLTCKSTILLLWDKSKFLFETLIIPIIFYDCEVLGYNISRESQKKIEQIYKCFITYNLKIKSNSPYPILLLSKSINMTRYLMKYMINNMEATNFLKLL